MTADTPDTAERRLREAHDRLNCNVAPCGSRMKSEADLNADRAEAMAACWRGADTLHALAAERDALVRVAEAARAVAAWKEPIQMIAPELGGALKAIYVLEAALDALPLGLGQSDT